MQSDSLKGLTKNPLGVLGIFCLFIESIVGTVFSIGIDKLTSPDERLPIIWFIIIFPVLLLVIFIILVIFYPGHLYSPSDFKDENNFIRIIQSTPKEIDENINKEVKDIEKETDYNAEKRDGEDKAPEKITKIEIGSRDSNSLRKEIIESEKQGVDEASKIFGVPLLQNVKIKLGKIGRTCEFDGFYAEGKKVYCVEVKYCPTNFPYDSLGRIRDTISRQIDFLNSSGFDVECMLMVILKEYSEEKATKIRAYCSLYLPSIKVEVSQFNPSN